MTRSRKQLYTEICHIPLIDPHSHIDPHQPTARSLDDILGYHYYTELAHSAGMDKGPLAPEVEPRERVRAILYHMAHFDNTVQYLVPRNRPRLLELSRATASAWRDATGCANAAERLMAQPDWEERVLRSPISRRSS